MQLADWWMHCKTTVKSTLFASDICSRNKNHNTTRRSCASNAGKQMYRLVPYGIIVLNNRCSHWVIWITSLEQVLLALYNQRVLSAMCLCLPHYFSHVYMYFSLNKYSSKSNVLNVGSPKTVLVSAQLTMSNVALGLSLESGHLASLARLPGITYLRTCNTALTQMYSRKGLRHFCSKVLSSQIDFILVFMYFSIVSAPGHFCIAALYKFSMYCIVLYRRLAPLSLFVGLDPLSSSDRRSFFVILPIWTT